MFLPSFDIFCRVIDNFGDIGVSWRLARQLARGTAPGAVRLWVDDLHSFAKIEPRIKWQARQRVGEVEIVRWTDPAPSLAPHDVVIEAFGCELPSSFKNRMADKQSLWLNLEYLSAEDWVESCHGLPSLQANGLQKQFFFPGFTGGTGGLLREAGLIDARDAWLSRPANRSQLLRELGVPSGAVERLLQGWKQIFLFCYISAPVEGLMKALAQAPNPSILMVPEGVSPGLSLLQTERSLVVEIPFVEQDTFDRLLWSSDLNFVRGEDSLVRAIWAGKPFVWQIYAQEDNAHIAKLDAYLSKTGANRYLTDLTRFWNTSNAERFSLCLSQSLQVDAWADWKQSAASLSARLAAEPSLVTRLMESCAEMQRKS